MVRSVHVLPHTHWDREWYDPFPTFRGRLVAMLDELLPRLEADQAFHHFQLDGQMAVVDDYLTVRPQQRKLIGELSTAGRLSMGPWYVLPDEFLVSGETLIRNLQLGIARAEEFGGAMHVGYLPDMFGQARPWIFLFVRCAVRVMFIQRRNQPFSPECDVHSATAVEPKRRLRNQPAVVP